MLSILVKFQNLCKFSYQTFPVISLSQNVEGRSLRIFRTEDLSRSREEGVQSRWQDADLPQLKVREKSCTQEEPQKGN